MSNDNKDEGRSSPALGSALWKRASEDDGEEGGWTLSIKFLSAVRAVCDANGESVSLEQIEAVLLASETTGILLQNT